MQNDEAETSAMADETGELEITAVVYPPGAGGGKVPTSPTWTMRFEIQPWRIVGQAVEETQLILSQEVGDDELRRLQELLRPYTVIRARIRLRPQQPTYADLVELIDAAATDADLEARAEALQVPITREDAVFGTLTYDRRFDEWGVNATWDGKPAQLSIPAAEDEFDGALNVAHTLWNDAAAWNKRLTEYAAHELLDLKNDNWLEDDDDEPLTAQQFVDALTVESIGVGSDGTYTVYYDDGDLFFGHVIIVSGSLEGGPDDAEIAG